MTKYLLDNSHFNFRIELHVAQDITIFRAVYSELIAARSVRDDEETTEEACNKRSDGG